MCHGGWTIPEEQHPEEWHLRSWLREFIVASRFFPLLAALVILLFLVYPLVETYGSPGFLLNVFVTTTFIVSLRAIASNHRMIKAIILIALPMFGSRIWAEISEDPVAMIVYTSLTILFLTVVLLTCLSRVVDRTPIDTDKILGAVCVYLLIAIIFSFVYELLYLFDANAIAVGNGSGEPDATRQFWVFTYFSFVTLTTLGYGDVLPVTPLARSMATLEAVLGPLYLAILIARLVSLADVGAPKRKRSRRGSDSAVS